MQKIMVLLIGPWQGKDPLNCNLCYGRVGLFPTEYSQETCRVKLEPLPGKEFHHFSWHLFL